ncbi:MEKHLA domain-containing protein [Novosphingobium sp. JCM 18896]|uniref:MEKHLA domain-containing protein n=1 Tax=Novosphingobium sp. JCM 18896 TaxID=2989731 RepID=UPI0022216D04|nr:MEKHLA domain-containing protein [Novosphingobium sp. JCM 18896]MCW1428312.1 MEKHLA domain-containing protein [Novosphingobium sp. JCM 18896]
MTAEPVPPQYRDEETAARIALIAESFERLLRRPLVPHGEDMVAALWDAPCAIVAHGTEPDPVFFFGNRAALTAFDCDVAGFVTMPSRLSAEEMLRDERQSLLDRVTRDGFIDDYGGMRVSATGRRFRIDQAVVWNLIDAHGARHGQAATFTV